MSMYTYINNVAHLIMQVFYYDPVLNMIKSTSVILYKLQFVD